MIDLTPLEGDYDRGLEVLGSTEVKVAEVVGSLHRQLEDALKLLDSPETEDFFKGIELEAAHQRKRWPSAKDAEKAPPDWFWLVGYLAGKCLSAHLLSLSLNNTATQRRVLKNKALHHTISTAAACANWHRAIKGYNDMQPGLENPPEE